MKLIGDELGNDVRPRSVCGYAETARGVIVLELELEFRKLVDVVGLCDPPRQPMSFISKT